MSVSIVSIIYMRWLRPSMEPHDTVLQRLVRRVEATFLTRRCRVAFVLPRSSNFIYKASYHRFSLRKRTLCRQQKLYREV